MTLSFSSIDEDYELSDLAVHSVLSQKPERAGYGNCSKCTCTGYEDALTGNSYCRCGHANGDHW